MCLFFAYRCLTLYIPNNKTEVFDYTYFVSQALIITPTHKHLFVLFMHVDALWHVRFLTYRMLNEYTFALWKDWRVQEALEHCEGRLPR